VSLRALGKNVEVQWAIGQQIGKFELCRSTDAVTLPMIVDDTEICSWSVAAFTSIRCSLAH
jgi:hypothetical protein